MTKQLNPDNAHSDIAERQKREQEEAARIFFSGLKQKTPVPWMTWLLLFGYAIYGFPFEKASYNVFFNMGRYIGQHSFMPIHYSSKEGLLLVHRGGNNATTMLLGFIVWMVLVPIAYLALCRLMERVLGHFRWAVVFLIAVIVGSLFTVVGSGIPYSSIHGAILPVIGVFFAYVLIQRKRIPSLVRKSYMSYCWLNVIFCFLIDIAFFDLYGKIAVPGSSMLSDILFNCVVDTLLIGLGFLVGLTASVIFPGQKRNFSRRWRVLAGMVYMIIAVFALFIIPITYMRAIKQIVFMPCVLIEERFLAKWPDPPDVEEEEKYAKYLDSFLNDNLNPMVAVLESVPEKRRTPSVKAVLNATKARIDAVVFEQKTLASGDLSLWPEVRRRYEYADKLDEEIPTE